MNAPALHPLFHGVSPQGEEKFYQPFVWDNMVGSPPRRRGKDTRPDYDTFVTVITAIMGMTLFAEYIDGIAVETITPAETA